jgi:hypothetical protein
MKIVASYLLITLAVLSACSTGPQRAAEAARLPLLRVPEDEALIATFESDPVKSQPWLAGERHPPTSVADLGLKDDVLLVSREVYLDGGSQAYLLRDGADRFFLFCTSNPRDREPSFLLGVQHFTDPQICRVPTGTRSYQFLFDLLWSFSGDPRYQYSAEQLQRAQESSGMSKEEFQRLQEKPNQPPQRNAGSRPSSGDSSASETPSSLGPRG